MKKLLQILIILTIGFIKAQTAGTLSINFTQPTPANLHQPGIIENILAIWVEDTNGKIISTIGDWYGVDSGDHLPNWSTKANCTINGTTLTGCTVNTDAMSGATLNETTTPKSFGTQNFSWKGTDSQGNNVADGNYIVFIESAWEGATDNAHDGLFQIPVTKTSTITNSNPTSDANFTNVSATWTPKSMAVNDIDTDKSFIIYPNPVGNTFTIKSSEKAKLISIYDAAGHKVKIFENAPVYDISNLKTGVYFVEIKTTENKTHFQKLIKK